MPKKIKFYLMVLSVLVLSAGSVHADGFILYSSPSNTYFNSTNNQCYNQQYPLGRWVYASHNGITKRWWLAANGDYLDTSSMVVMPLNAYARPPTFLISSTDNRVFYCRPLNSYYPDVETCPMPWALLNKN